MSVLIKGMKMPKNCMMCQFHGFGGYKNELIVCSLTGRSEGQLSNVLDCPLVEVPSPHGPLFDANALISYRFRNPISYNAFVRLVERMPATIEAEEGEEE